MSAAYVQQEACLLTACRLLLYPDMMYGYYPKRLPVTREAAEKRKGVRVEMGGMMRYTSHYPVLF